MVLSSFFDSLALVIGYLVIISSAIWWIFSYTIKVSIDKERFLFKIFGFGFIYCFDAYSRVYHNLNNSRGKLNQRFFWVNTDRFD
jgi:hypothetical protein